MAGKTSTRQKMINLLYLVFIAMLALNISKEVLATLGILNDDLESSIVELESSSKINYDQISSNSDNLDYKILNSISGLKLIHHYSVLVGKKLLITKPQGESNFAWQRTASARVDDMISFRVA